MLDKIMHMFGNEWINNKDYTFFALITFGAGCYLWAIVYGIVIYDIFKKKRADSPFGAIAACIAWEFWWGLGFRQTDMGAVLQLSYFIWFFLDCFIVYSAFRYGWKQSITVGGIKNHVPMMALFTITWGVIFYFFIVQMKQDDKIGAWSGWIVNVYMSILYCVQKIKQPTFGTNRWVAVLKFLATGLCTGVVFDTPYLYANKTLVALCFIFAAFDIMYIYLVFTGPKSSEVLDEEQAVETKADAPVMANNG
jgi:hypothetical protein